MGGMGKGFVPTTEELHLRLTSDSGPQVHARSRPGGAGVCPALSCPRCSQDNYTLFLRKSLTLKDFIIPWAWPRWWPRGLSDDSLRNWFASFKYSAGSLKKKNPINQKHLWKDLRGTDIEARPRALKPVGAGRALILQVWGPELRFPEPMSKPGRHGSLPETHHMAGINRASQNKLVCKTTRLTNSKFSDRPCLGK